MKLKLLQSMAGIDFSHNVGDVIEVKDAEAVKRYVERGIAEIVKTTKKRNCSKENRCKRDSHERLIHADLVATAPR